jgi:DNA gyrase subunit A
MPAAGISEQGRATQGVKLIRVDEGDEIAAITKLDELDQHEQPVAGEEVPLQPEMNEETPLPGSLPGADEAAGTEEDSQAGEVPAP